MIALVAAAIVCGVAAVVVVVTDAPSEPGQHGLLEALIVGVPILAGMSTLRSSTDRRFGLLLIGSGMVWSLTALAETSDSALYSIGRVSAWLIFPVLVYLMLAFPTGRLTNALDRRLFAGVAGIITLLYMGSALLVDAYPLYTPWATCDLDCPGNAFQVVGHEPAIMHDLIAPARELVGSLLLIAVTVRLFQRARASRPLRRLVVSPVAFMSGVSTLMLIAYFFARRSSDADTAEALGVVWSLTLPATAAAFLVGLLRQRAIAGDMLTRLSVALGERLDRHELRSTLATVLDDPQIDVLTPGRMTGRWRDSQGRPATPWGATARGLAVSAIGDNGRPAAVLVHDPSLDDKPLLDAVGALVLATLRHERALTELEVSRKRIARAADVERSRIERDLHDGAQQRLIGLRIKLTLAEELTHADPEAGALAMHELGEEVDRTLEELRSLAHGVYPALLSDRGIADALRSALAQSPVPVHVVTHQLARYPPEIETAVYFTCLEAVQNAIKHGEGASGLWLTVYENHGLRFEVRDDGAGFVPLRGEHNGGLRNMRDRVEAIGGRLTIESAPGEGVSVHGVVPLG